MSPKEPFYSFSLTSVRLLWVLCAVLSTSIPIIHYWLIQPLLNAWPRPLELLPADLSFLQDFGQASKWFQIVSVAILAWTFFRPAEIRVPSLLSIGAYSIFLLAYVCYTLGELHWLLEQLKAQR